MNETSGHEEQADLDHVSYVLGQRAERDRIRRAVLDHYKVAPKAAEPLLRRIKGEEEPWVIVQ